MAILGRNHHVWKTCSTKDCHNNNKNVYYSLRTRPSGKSEGASGREAGVEVYWVECMKFVVISSYPLYFWNIQQSVGLIRAQLHMYAPTTSLARGSLYSLSPWAVAVSTCRSIKITCECNYEPIKSMPAFHVHSTLPPQPIFQTLFLIFLRVWFQDYIY